MLPELKGLAEAPRGDRNESLGVGPGLGSDELGDLNLERDEKRVGRKHEQPENEKKKFKGQTRGATDKWLELSLADQEDNLTKNHSRIAT